MDTLFGSGFQGKSPNITAQRRVNCYYEYNQDGDKTRVSIIGTPGLVLFKDVGDTTIRGMYAPHWNSNLYFVHRSTLYEVNNAGVSTSLGTLDTSSGRVAFSDNGTEIMLVDGTYGYIYNTGTLAFAKIADADFPANPNTVCFDSSRFLVNAGGTGRFYGSDGYSGTAWNALNYATAESIPDDLVRIEAMKGLIVLFGDYSIEYWANAGLPGFPYSRVSAANQDFGLAARWSVSTLAGTLAFLAKTREGQVIVARLNGYQVEPISTPELDYVINNFASVADATAFSYMLGGHPMYQINFPAAGYSFLYDASTGVWSDLKSEGLNRHRADLGINYLNKTYVGDYSVGKIYKIEQDTYTEDGGVLRMELVSRHLFNEGKLQRITSFQVDGEMGVGLVTGQGSDPQVMLTISKDGGHTFGTEMWSTLGKVGAYMTRARWRNLGAARDWVFKLVVTDPVKRVITGVYINQP